MEGGGEGELRKGGGRSGRDGAVRGEFGFKGGDALFGEGESRGGSEMFLCRDEAELRQRSLEQEKKEKRTLLLSANSSRS